MFLPPKPRGHRDEDEATLSKAPPPPAPTPASAPRQKVVVFIESRNICREFSIGGSCLTKQCPHVHGHTPHVHHAASARAQPDGGPGLRPWGERDPSKRVLGSPVDTGRLDTATRKTAGWKGSKVACWRRSRTIC